MAPAAQHGEGWAARFTNVTKVFPPDIVALSCVSADVRVGEIRAFVGENGAGKSTLMRILAGETLPDSGSIEVGGRAVSYRSARDAIDDGVGMVHQEILLVPELTVWENVVLGVEPLRSGVFGLGRIDTSAARGAVRRSIAASGMDLDPDAIVSELSVAARQKVEICKLLHRDVGILILDEPTAVLAPQEIPALFDELRRLRDSGRTICLVSHRLDEVLKLSDRITVLRDGRAVATLDASSTTPSELARLMVERDVVLASPPSPRASTAAGAVVLELEGLKVARTATSAGLGPIDLRVHAGEIVGIAGVEGNGQTELVGAVLGSVAVVAGTLRVGGVDVAGRTIGDRRRLIGFVASDRRTQGSAPLASLADNSTMTNLRLDREFTRARRKAVRYAYARRFTARILSEFDVAAHSVQQPMGTLSGGNQQKVILGRELSADRPLVILDQPTRGLDVGSIEYVHRRIVALRDHGRAVLLVSADLDELLRTTDRIVVLHRGRIALDVIVADATVATIGAAMLHGPLPGRGDSSERLVR